MTDQLMGYASAIDLQSFRSIFPSAVRDQPYYFCFSDVVIKCVEYAAMCIPGGEIEITFNRNAEVEFNAGLVYNSMEGYSLPSRLNILRNAQDYWNSNCRSSCARNNEAYEQHPWINNERAAVIYGYPGKVTAIRIIHKSIPDRHEEQNTANGSSSAQKLLGWL